MQTDNEILTDQLQELKTHLNPENNTEIIERLDLISELITTRRKYLYLEEKEIRLKHEIYDLNENHVKYKTLTDEQITNLQNNIEKQQLENTYLKNSLNEMVPLNKYTNIEKQLLDMTLKYRQIIDQINNNNVDNNYLERIEHLENLIRNENQEEIDVSSNENVQKKLQIEIKRSNNLTNLLEINKDQLKSYEQRIKDLESEINMLKMKNIELQTTLNDTQTQIINSVSEDVYNTICSEKEQLLKEFELLQIDFDTVKLNYLSCMENISSYKKWRTVDEQELIGLKHLIVDLQAISDDKAIIAKLNFDIEILRKKEFEYLNKIELLQQEKELFYREKTINLNSDNKQSQQIDVKIFNELKIKNR